MDDTHWADFSTLLKPPYLGVKLEMTGGMKLYIL
jgi:hypothetical protein